MILHALAAHQTPTSRSRMNFLNCTRSYGYQGLFSRVFIFLLNLLKPKTYIMYHQLNIRKFCVLPTMHLCVLCGSQKKQRFFLYTELTYRFLEPKQRVFTARYELSL